jgi:phage terminase large subunit
MLSMLIIEPVGIADYYGIALDGDKRFLLEDGTVTHNSGKSWAYARALLIQSVQTPLRILCAREVQKSIKQSVKQLLEDQIEALGLSKQFLVQETEIRGANGTQIYFAGLGNQTADSIKSFEGVDRVWVEEAQTVSKRSWDILIPTIRKPGSEIWITFNPELDTDETYQRFVATPPPESAVVEINYADNPWFPEVLEQERLHCQTTDPEGYRTIWEGQCRSAVHGAIYAGEVDAAIREQRICNVPYDPMLRAHAIWDLGWNDAKTIIVAQRLRSEIRIIDYIEDSHKTLDWYVAELKERHYNWGFDFLPHDADHKDFKTGKSTTQLLKAFGRKPKLTPNLPVEKGIKQARMTFGQCYFDKTKAARLVECLKRYRRRVPESTGEPGAPIHDEFSHGADGFRYLSLVADELTNEMDKPIPPARQAWSPFDASVGY